MLYQFLSHSLLGLPRVSSLGGKLALGPGPAPLVLAVKME